MANILCLETSTDICSVALSTDDRSLRIVQEGKQNRSHAAEIITLIQSCLQVAKLTWSDLSAVAVSSGPGSFTGLRVGTTTAKGICFAHDLPLISVDTLCSIGMSIELPEDRPAHRLVLLHARKQEVYAQLLNQDGKTIDQRRVVDLALTPIEDLTASLGNVIIITDHIEVVSPWASGYHMVEATPHAAHLRSIAQSNYNEKVFVDLNSYTPTYVKAPYITTPKKSL